MLPMIPKGYEKPAPGSMPGAKDVIAISSSAAAGGFSKLRAQSGQRKGA